MATHNDVWSAFATGLTLGMCFVILVVINITLPAAAHDAAVKVHTGEWVCEEALNKTYCGEK